MDDTDKKVIALVAIIALLIASYGGYRIVRGRMAEEALEDLSIQKGDTVIVDYIGFIQDSRLYGTERRVFDTSNESIAHNDDAYPKTLGFNLRAQYEPLRFEVGAGNVIRGWDINIKGMDIGDSAEWYIPPELGYQPRLEELMITHHKEATAPVYETLTLERFEEIYLMEPGPEMPIAHAYWGWPAKVYEVTESHVTIENGAIPHDTYTTTYGWETTIKSIDQAADGGDGLITIEHRPQIGDVVNAPLLAEYDEEMKDIISIQQESQGAGPGIVVNVGDETFTVDYNREVFGRELIFRVTVIDIIRE